MAAAALRGPISMRFIGSFFDPQNEASFYRSRLFPEDFDLLLYVAFTHESARLPAVP